MSGGGSAAPARPSLHEALTKALLVVGGSA
jgi:hypothetical protein